MYLKGSNWSMNKRRKPSSPWLIGILLLAIGFFAYLNIYVIPTMPPPFLPNAPALTRMFPNLWQTLKIEQGTPNFEALQASEAVLAQDGVLVIYPEGHVHGGPLRRALPGAAYMALRTGVPILPMGTISDNNWKLFKSITEDKRRLGVFTKIGEVFGPLSSDHDKRPSREEIREAGHLIMSKIGALLPKEYRGDFDSEII